MENVYSCYTKTVNSTTFYFVKKFIVFPEFKEIEPLLESYGMHADFDKACEIALIKDAAIKEVLLNEIKERGAKTKVIDLNDQHFFSQRKTGSLSVISFYNSFRNTLFAAKKKPRLITQ